MWGEVAWVQRGGGRGGGGEVQGRRLRRGHLLFIVLSVCLQSAAWNNCVFCAYILLLCVCEPISLHLSSTTLVSTSSLHFCMFATTPSPWTITPHHSTDPKMSAVCLFLQSNKAGPPAASGRTELGRGDCFAEVAYCPA